jgi:polyketide biosynthesis acyl carrier protein
MDKSHVFDVIVRCTREVLPDLESHEFRPEERLADLGANSIDRAEIVVLVLEALSLRVPRTEVFGPNNIGELADLLHIKTHSL